jgi:hypothetical protein
MDSATPLITSCNPEGIWRSVYVADVSTVSIEHVVPQITYLGEYPTTPLSEGTVRVF